MGIVKALMMEMEEAQWETSDVTFFCPECKSEIDGTVELPVVYDDSDSTHLPVNVQCFSGGHSFDGWVKTDWDSCEIELDDYPEKTITTDPMRGFASDYDDYDHDYYEWLEQQEQLSRPLYRAFNQTISDVKALTSQVLLDDRSQMLARMLLAQSITAFEAFLADTLILTVANNPKAQENLLGSKSLGIGSKKFELADAIGVEDFAKARLLAYLRAVSFHDVQKANRLFRVGLGINILPEGEELERVHKAIKMRHDCVHRNGVDRETGELHQIDQALLLGLATTLETMIKSIDQKVDDIETPM